MKIGKFEQKFIKIVSVKKAVMYLELALQNMNGSQCISTYFGICYCAIYSVNKSLFFNPHHDTHRLGLNFTNLILFQTFA